MKPNFADSPDRFLWFTRAGIRFAASMEYLQEVLPLTGLRKLPAAEPSLSGLIILRELILPVFDPVAFISLNPVPVQAQANAIVLRLAGRPALAVVAEEVGQVVALPPPPRVSSPVRLAAAFAGELAPAGGGHTFILNVPEFAALMGLSKLNASVQTPLQL